MKHAENDSSAKSIRHPLKWAANGLAVVLGCVNRTKSLACGAGGTGVAVVLSVLADRSAIAISGCLVCSFGDTMSCRCDVMARSDAAETLGGRHCGPFVHYLLLCTCKRAVVFESVLGKAYHATVIAQSAAGKALADRSGLCVRMRQHEERQPPRSSSQ